MDGYRCALAKTISQGGLDGLGDFVGVVDGHSALDADMHLDGYIGAETTSAEVVGFEYIGSRQYYGENLLLDLARKTLLKQLFESLATEINGDLDDECGHHNSRYRIGYTPLLTEEIGRADTEQCANRR